ncbi:four helix bundle protein [Sulfurovum sp.]|uniref:four helix bundle protein n=1 Tax=Sulfurovum sp. TaxID=1969726 RepID=UPI0025D22890|nr:four helix bundle protein [Sulfurovum sp.]
MRSEHLPVFKAALDLCVYLDSMVKNMEKYHKYGIGSEMRETSREMLYLVNSANVQKAEERVVCLRELVQKCEKLKLMILLAKEIKAFKSFKQFEHSSLLSVSVCKQAQAWLGASARVSL